MYPRLGNRSAMAGGMTTNERDTRSPAVGGGLDIALLMVSPCDIAFLFTLVFQVSLREFTHYRRAPSTGDRVKVKRHDSKQGGPSYAALPMEELVERGGSRKLVPDLQNQGSSFPRPRAHADRSPWSTIGYPHPFMVFLQHVKIAAFA